MITAHAPDASGEDVTPCSPGPKAGQPPRPWRPHSAAPSTGRPPEPSRPHGAPGLDYLLGEVFLTLPAATRHLLLCTGDEDIITEETATLLSVDPDAGHASPGWRPTGCSSRAIAAAAPIRE